MQKLKDVADELHLIAEAVSFGGHEKSRPGRESVL
jgi:hypothetical protein